MKTTNQHYARDLRRYYRLPATQVSLTVVLSLLIVAGFVAFALRPTMVAIVTLKKTIVESRKTLQQLENKVVNLQKAAEQLELIKPMLSSLNMSIASNGASYNPMTDQIELLAAQTGVQIQSESLGSTLLYSRVVSPFTPQRNQSVVTLPINVRVTGSYAAVVEFLAQFLNMERLVGVESVAITKEASSRNESVVVGLSISGSAYYLADEAQLKTALVEQKGGK